MTGLGIPVDAERAGPWTWLVCEHGPIGTRPLLAMSQALGPRSLLVTTSLSSHLFARIHRHPSVWIGQWRRPTHLDPDAADVAEAEIARARRYTSDVRQIVAAVSTIAEGLERVWMAAPPGRIIIWEQWSRTLGRLVVREACRHDVPVLVVSDGPVEGTLLVDRVLGSRRQVLAERPLPPSTGAGRDLRWRRPTGRGAATTGHVIASAGLRLDHVERASRAVLGRPALIPWAYWTGYVAGRVRDRASIARVDIVPDELEGFVLLALHTPAALGRFADPLELLDVCLTHVAPERPLVISPHPGDRNLGFPRELWTRLKERPGTYLARSQPAWSLLPRAGLVITLTSTIGCEALARRIPTLALGGAYFVRRGLANPLGSEAARLIDAASRDPASFAPDPDVVSAFLDLLVAEHLVTASASPIDANLGNAIVGRVSALERITVPVTR